jgi:hypothetical protein
MTRSTWYELRLFAIAAIRRIADHRSALAVALMLCCATLVVTAHRGLMPESSPSEVPAAIPAASSESVKSNLAQLPLADKRGLHGIVFTLYPAGIEPAVQHTTKGLVAVSIEDHSGGTAGLVIEREIASVKVSLGQVIRDLDHWRGRTEMRLEPGRYRVFDSSRPDNDAELIVDP